MSLIAICAYGIDKFKAKMRGWRTKEALLLAVSVLGGAPGALVGMMLFNHKTTRLKFWLANLLGIALIALSHWFLYKYMRTDF